MKINSKNRNVKLLIFWFCKRHYYTIIFITRAKITTHSILQVLGLEQKQKPKSTTLLYVYQYCFSSPITKQPAEHI